MELRTLVGQPRGQSDYSQKASRPQTHNVSMRGSSVCLDLRPLSGTHPANISQGHLIQEVPTPVERTDAGSSEVPLRSISGGPQEPVLVNVVLTHPRLFSAEPPTHKPSLIMRAGVKGLLERTLSQQHNCFLPNYRRPNMKMARPATGSTHDQRHQIIHGAVQKGRRRASKRQLVVSSSAIVPVPQTRGDLEEVMEHPQQPSRVIKIQTATPYMMDQALTVIKSEDNNTLNNSASKRTPNAFSSVANSPKPNLAQGSVPSTPGKSLAPQGSQPSRVVIQSMNSQKMLLSVPDYMTMTEKKQKINNDSAANSQAGRRSRIIQNSEDTYNNSSSNHNQYIQQQRLLESRTLLPVGDGANSSLTLRNRSQERVEVEREKLRTVKPHKRSNSSLLRKMKGSHSLIQEEGKQEEMQTGNPQQNVLSAQLASMNTMSPVSSQTHSNARRQPALRNAKTINSGTGTRMVHQATHGPAEWHVLNVGLFNIGMNESEVGGTIHVSESRTKQMQVTSSGTQSQAGRNLSRPMSGTVVKKTGETRVAKQQDLAGLIVTNPLQPDRSVPTLKKSSSMVNQETAPRPDGPLPIGERWAVVEDLDSFRRQDNLLAEQIKIKPSPPRLAIQTDYAAQKIPILLSTSPLPIQGGEYYSQMKQAVEAVEDKRRKKRKESPVKISQQNIELNIPQPELQINTHRSSNMHLDQQELISFGISVSKNPMLKQATTLKKSKSKGKQSLFSTKAKKSKTQVKKKVKDPVEEERKAEEDLVYSDSAQATHERNIHLAVINSGSRIENSNLFHSGGTNDSNNQKFNFFENRYAPDDELEVEKVHSPPPPASLKYLSSQQAPEISVPLTATRSRVTNQQDSGVVNVTPAEPLAHDPSSQFLVQMRETANGQYVAQSLVLNLSETRQKIQLASGLASYATKQVEPSHDAEDAVLNSQQQQVSLHHDLNSDDLQSLINLARGVEGQDLDPQIQAAAQAALNHHFQNKTEEAKPVHNRVFPLTVLNWTSNSNGFQQLVQQLEPFSPEKSHVPISQKPMQQLINARRTDLNLRSKSQPYAQQHLRRQEDEERQRELSQQAIERKLQIKQLQIQGMNIKTVGQKFLEAASQRRETANRNKIYIYDDLRANVRPVNDASVQDGSSLVPITSIHHLQDGSVIIGAAISNHMPENHIQAGASASGGTSEYSQPHLSKLMGGQLAPESTRMHQLLYGGDATTLKGESSTVVIQQRPSDYVQNSARGKRKNGRLSTSLNQDIPTGMLVGRHYESSADKRRTSQPLRKSAEDAVVIAGRNEHIAMAGSTTTVVDAKKQEEDQTIYQTLAPPQVIPQTMELKIKLRNNEVKLQPINTLSEAVDGIRGDITSRERRAVDQMLRNSEEFGESFDHFKTLERNAEDYLFDKNSPQQRRLHTAAGSKRYKHLKEPESDEVTVMKIAPHQQSEHDALAKSYSKMLRSIGEGLRHIGPYSLRQHQQMRKAALSQKPETSSFGGTTTRFLPKEPRLLAKPSGDMLNNPSILQPHRDEASSHALSFQSKPNLVSTSLERVEELIKAKETNFISSKNLPTRLFSASRKLAQRIQSGVVRNARDSIHVKSNSNFSSTHLKSAAHTRRTQSQEALNQLAGFEGLSQSVFTGVQLNQASSAALPVRRVQTGHVSVRNSTPIRSSMRQIEPPKIPQNKLRSFQRLKVTTLILSILQKGTVFRDEDFEAKKPGTNPGYKFINMY